MTLDVKAVVEAARHSWAHADGDDRLHWMRTAIVAALRSVQEHLHGNDALVIRDLADEIEKADLT